MKLFSNRAEGSNILLDPMQVCKKTQRMPNKISEICRQDSRNKTSLLKKITKGITLGFRECENQFRNRKWNCTSQRRSMKKVLLKGKLICFCSFSLPLPSRQTKFLIFRLPLAKGEWGKKQKQFCDHKL